MVGLPGETGGELLENSDFIYKGKHSTSKSLSLIKFLKNTSRIHPYFIELMDSWIYFRK